MTTESLDTVLLTNSDLLKQFTELILDKLSTESDLFLVNAKLGSDEFNTLLFITTSLGEFDSLVFDTSLSLCNGNTDFMALLF